MRVKASLFAALSLSGMAVATPKEPASLKIGSPAPAIRDVRWVQGAPITKLVSGKVYVIEFWATWCGPCKAAMPHLSELSKRYHDQAIFTGVSILEDSHGLKGPEASLNKVKDYMAKNPGRMNYNVCVDAGGANGFMAKNWFGAAGQRGIPCTMVVGKDTKLAWIGHPMQLDDVLPGVLKGTFNVATFEAEQQRKQIAQEKADEANVLALKKVEEAVRTQQYETALMLIARSIKQRPESAARFDDLFVQAVLGKGDEKALQEAMKTFLSEKRGGFGLLTLGEMLKAKDTFTKETYMLGGKCMDLFITLITGETVDQFNSVGAALYAKAGEYKLAVQRQELAVASAEKDGKAAVTLKMKEELSKYKALALTTG